MAKFPDAEAVVCDLLEQVAPTATQLDKGWDDVLPVIQVNRIGGRRDQITDVARIQVAVWASSRAEVRTLADDIDELILSAGNTRVNGVLIDWTEQSIAGQQVPDVDPDDRRIISTYQLAFRRHFA
jgi:hypothetical protein